MSRSNSWRRTEYLCWTSTSSGHILVPWWSIITTRAELERKENANETMSGTWDGKYNFTTDLFLFSHPSQSKWRRPVANLINPLRLKITTLGSLIGVGNFKVSMIINWKVITNFLASFHEHFCPICWYKKRKQQKTLN